MDEGFLSSTFSTKVSIPYIQGDADGKLTDALIKQLSLSPQFEYVSNGGSLILEGKIVRDSQENIGYQYNRQPVSGKRINTLIPNEGRREIEVEFSLIEEGTQKVIYGPVNVSSEGDYDFFDADSLRDTSFIDQTGRRQSVLFFSLGQLDSVEGASQVVLDSIYRNLANKLVMGLENLHKSS